MPPSFKSVNYALRPNKCVERRLLVEGLRVLDGRFGLRGHQYIGLGSMWYADFILMHTVIGLTTLTSIEREEAYKTRAEFNRPYSCIKLCIGESSTVLPTLDWSKPSVVWMDYDDEPTKDILTDITTITAKAHELSAIFVSTNAAVRSLGTDRSERESSLRDVFESFIPDELPSHALQKNGYPPYLASLLLSFLSSATRQSGRPETFVPILNMRYADGVEMVTVGGLLVDDARIKEIEDCDMPPGMGTASADAQYRIRVPNLTLREKLRLDRAMPSGGAHPPKKDLPFVVDSDQLKSFQELYRFYPTYGEVGF